MEKDYTRDMLSKIRGINCRNTSDNYGLLREATEKKDNKQKAIAITDEPKFGQTVLKNQIEEFRASVDSGAQFSEADNEHPENNPLIYIPSNGNIVFSGIIPCLNNLKFQFVLKSNTGNGCFIWSDGLILNKDNIQLLNKLYGFYSNWKDQWNSEAKDLATIAKNEE